MVMATRRTSFALLAILALLATGLPVGASPVPGPGLDSLRPGLGACGTLTEVALPQGGIVCTHGSDPPPAGADIKTSVPPARPSGLILPDTPNQQATAAAAASPSVRCYGDGQSGNRVHVIYARPADRPDRYGQYLASFKQWSAETDAVFAASAARTGGVRHIRFVTDAACGLVVDNVVLGAESDDTFENTVVALSQKGYNRSDRKYLVFMDATQLCGIAGYYIDDRATTNFNNGTPGVPGPVARVDAGCWGFAGQGESVEAHEIMHSLGSVMPSAPHMTAAGHCRDDSDRMCYSDGLHISMLSICGSAGEALFDCGNDDYFHTAPPAGNYLASHWNTAASSFLTSDPGDPLLSVGDLAVREGNTGSSEATLTVALSAPTSNTVAVTVSTANGSATAGQDYDAVSTRVSIPAGQVSRTVGVPIRGERADEGDETVLINLGAPVGARLARNQSVLTIVDDDPPKAGYWLVANDGGIFSFGEAAFYGSTGNIKLNRPINGMVGTNSARGYWMVADDGGIFAFGDAAFFGSTGDRVLPKPVIGMATTQGGGGYWLATQDGKVFPFGDAADLGGIPSPPGAPVVGIAATPSGRGYWLVGRDGRVYPFGDARDLGGAPAGDVVGMAASPTGPGYWIVTQGGNVFGLGGAPVFQPTEGRKGPIIGIAASPTGEGYWTVGTDGEVYVFGDAGDLGSMGTTKLNLPVVGMSALR